MNVFTDRDLARIEAAIHRGIREGMAHNADMLAGAHLMGAADMPPATAARKVRELREALKEGA